MFKNLFSSEKKEKVVFELIKKHLELLNKSSDLLLKLLKEGNRELIEEIMDTEREADVVRREILSVLYKGAFLPYLRPSLYRFVELLDETVDLIEDVARVIAYVDIPEDVQEEIVQIGFFNTKMSEMLSMSFDAFVKGFAIQEKILAIRIYEKRIDELSHDLTEKLVCVPVNDFWTGQNLFMLVTNLTKVSDLIEDCGDVLSLLDLSMK